MSDAQAAQVPENGVPPTAQDKVEETQGFKVFVGNLAYSTTDDGLKAFFEIVKDNVLSIQLIRRGNHPSGYGFVALATEDAANKAVEILNKQELDGRPVIVEIAKPADVKDREKKDRKANRRSGRRGSKAVPGEVTEAEANGEAPKAESAAASGTEAATKPKKKKKPSRKPKAKTEATTDVAPAATNGIEGETTAGDAAAAKKPRRKFKAPRTLRPIGQDPVGDPSKTMLFIANLGFHIDDEGLSALFTEADIKVVSARIVRRRWGSPRKSKGYGFVDVGSEEEQRRAIEILQGKDVGGRPIAVKIAVNAANEESADEANPAETDTGASAAPTTTA